jgi:hypothetical protein
MYLVYGIHPYGANGNTVVSNYPGGALAKVGNNGASLPAPGDIVSEAGTNSNPDGHTAVVTAVNVVNGSGAVTIMEENASSTGWGTIPVSGNVLGSRVTGWLHAAAQVHHARYDVNGDGRADTCMVTGVNGGGTGSGPAEVRCLYGATFSARFKIETPWGHLTTRTDPLFLADVNGDGRADTCMVAGVNGGTTGSGRAEVHCLYGGTFSSGVDVVTPWSYLRTRTGPLFLADVNGDGRADLCRVSGVNRHGTGSGHARVHCLDAASGFQSRLDVVTPWAGLRSRTDRLFMADVTGDGRADLCLVAGVNGGTTGSGRAEVHCLYGGTFSTGIDVATPWSYLTTRTDPLFAADVNGDGLSDLCQVTGVNGGTTGSGRAEVHCLDAASGFQSSLDIATPWAYLDTASDAILDRL